MKRKEHISLINTSTLMQGDGSVLDMTLGTLESLSILMRKPRAKNTFLSLQDCQQEKMIYEVYHQRFSNKAYSISGGVAHGVQESTMIV